ELDLNVGADTDEDLVRVRDQSESLGLVPRAVTVPVRVQTGNVVNSAGGRRQRRNVDRGALAIAQVRQLELQAVTSEERIRVSARVVHVLSGLEDGADEVVSASGSANLVHSASRDSGVEQGGRGPHGRLVHAEQHSSVERATNRGAAESRSVRQEV